MYSVKPIKAVYCLSYEPSCISTGISECRYGLNKWLTRLEWSSSDAGSSFFLRKVSIHLRHDSLTFDRGKSFTWIVSSHVNGSCETPVHIRSRSGPFFKGNGFGCFLVHYNNQPPDLIAFCPTFPPLLISLSLHAIKILRFKMKSRRQKTEETCFA